jgi:tRNA(Arg) A34 adenosine deaminase TadA
MCLSAAYWARIPTIYYGNTKADAKNIGFDDSFIYDEIAKPLENRSIQMVNLTEVKDYALSAFQEWAAKTDKTPY